MTHKDLELDNISALDLTALCTLVADAYAYDRSSVEGSVLAHLVKRMIIAETRPGGPYNDETGRLTVELNASIGRLFLLMGRPLPNVAAYLSTTRPASDADHLALEYYNRAYETVTQKRASHVSQHVSYRRVAKTLATLDEPIRTQASQFLMRIENADITREIAAISEFASRAFRTATIPAAKLDTLSEANIHSWIAYTIYDHILDKEADAVLLPAANVCMRLALEHYRRALPARHPLQPLITRYFNQVDTTCAWEIMSCRFAISDGSIHIGILPNYQRYEVLAWRSCIHILGPLIVSSFVPSLFVAETKHLIDGLHHYLIARQLGDDIHDWREDLAAGRISAVVSLLLARQEVKENSAYALTTLVSAIQEDFLREGSTRVGELILRHTERALSELASAGCDPSSELVGLVLRLERMAKESIQYQRQFVSFQNQYAAVNDEPIGL